MQWPKFVFDNEENMYLFINKIKINREYYIIKRNKKETIKK